MENIRIFIWKVSGFWVVKLSIYLNRHVFVMIKFTDFVSYKDRSTNHLSLWYLSFYAGRGDWRHRNNLITKDESEFPSQQICSCFNVNVKMSNWYCLFRFWSAFNGIFTILIVLFAYQAVKPTQKYSLFTCLLRRLGKACVIPLLLSEIIVGVCTHGIIYKFVAFKLPANFS